MFNFTTHFLKIMLLLASGSMWEWKEDYFYSDKEIIVMLNFEWLRINVAQI